MIRYLRDNQGRTTPQIIALIDEYAALRGLKVPSDIRNRLARQRAKETGRHTIVEVQPDGTPHEVVGTILAIDWRVNLLKTVGYSSSQIGRALLGKLSDVLHAKITLRGPPDPADNVIGQFTVYLPAEILEHVGARVNSLVGLTISARLFPGGKSVWMGREVSLLKKG